MVEVSTRIANETSQTVTQQASGHAQRAAA
jgi:hypothetical protein